MAPSADLYYWAAKHALIGLVRSFALIVGQDGITVNAMCPGFIGTRLVTPLRDALTAAGLAVAEPDEAADAAAAILAMDVTGQAWRCRSARPSSPSPSPTSPSAT